MLFLMVLFTSFSMVSQDIHRKNLNGKVSAPSQSLEGIYVLNLTSKKETVTKEGGYFTISSKVGDSLMFSSIQFKGKIVSIEEQDLNEDLFQVKLETMINQLDEVMVVKYKSLNAYDLGIIPRPAKVYTPAERKLRTATGVDAQVGLNSSFTLDPLFNLLSGRSAMLEKEVQIEKKERWIDQIENIYSEDYIVKKLKIPAEHIKGFQYFAVENIRFTNAIGAKDKSMARFLLGELAKKYNQILEDEK
ncbi:hypothetical protein ACFPVY_10165 [Flavobacterium qiangtangense]|uniref:Carboxypeptidase-like protein n=1 Tax=Flavobacterium qiangtangense TaxID=1442595 RepID=A0ABW1PPN1_9FLAO